MPSQPPFPLLPWPVPTWLHPPPGLPDAPDVLEIELATGELREEANCGASIEGEALILRSAGGGHASWPLREIHSITLRHRLSRTPDPAPSAAPAAAPVQDQRLSGELLPFTLHRRNDGAVQGRTLGYLQAPHSLFLYSLQGDGTFSGQCYPLEGLQAAHIGSLNWAFEPTGTWPTPTRAFPAPARNRTELLRALAEIHLRPARSLAQVLAELELLTPEELAALHRDEPALLQSDSAALVKRNLLTQDQLDRVLSRVAGAVEADARSFEVEPKALELVPWALAVQLTAMPLMLEGEVLHVATPTPTDQELALRLTMLTNRRVVLAWCNRLDLTIRTEKALSSPQGGHAAVSKQAAHFERERADPTIHELLTEAIAESAITDGEEINVVFVDESSSLVKFVRKLILDAHSSSASDIHIETNPGEELARIRFRKDGDLEPYLNVPATLRAALVSRIKVMARLDISERRRPQDGKINFADFGGPKLELRVAILPTHDGLEDVVMRLLASSKPIPLSKLGFLDRDMTIIRRVSDRSYGLILAAGPTGSGKTTTLHSMLSEINTEQRKIWTAEDPIEITQPGLRQLQVNAKIGLTFASAMRAFLRADPDVIMIGEIRDEETARIAIEASLTGHLVLSTLHTNNAPESVVRLLDLGMDPMNFADSLLAVIAQRLVRALCPYCARTAPLTGEAFTTLVQEYVEGSRIDTAAARARLLDIAKLPPDGVPLVKTAVGCDRCHGVGYKGRMGIYEILESSSTIRQMIQRKARPAELFDQATGEGMRRLRQDALEKVILGHIDLVQARKAYA